MKKFIFIVFAIFAFGSAFAGNDNSIGAKASSAVSTVYDDGKEVVTTVYNDSKDLIKSAYPEVKEAVKAIAGAIGVAAEHVYGVLVKKFVVDGVMHAMWFVAGLVLIIFGFRSSNKYMKLNDVITWKAVFPMLYIGVGAIILACVNYTDMLMGLINPEYGAINYIIEYTQTMMH